MADYTPPPPFFSSPSPFNHQIRASASAKAYNAEWKWLSSSEAKQRSKAAKAVALSDFKKRFPQANAQFRRRASAVPNLLQLGSTVARQKHDSDSDVVPESYQIQDLLKPRKN